MPSQKRGGIRSDLVLVEWHDAHSSSHWRGPDEALEQDHRPAICFTAGWVLKRDKVGITIFSSVADGEEIGDVIFILDGMVKKVTVLKKAHR